jgi:hypothetical protein
MLKCILWDFGDTIADEWWMLKPLDGVPDWMEAWTQVVSSELADSWNLGEVKTSTITSAVAPHVKR